MNQLTDGQIDAIPFPAIDYAAAHVIRTHRRTFARAVIAADRELQDAKLTNAPTDSQINDALKVFACTVIGADRAIQDARHLEELNAYALTVSNLRTEIAGRCVPDGWRLVPVEPNAEQIMAAAKAAKQYFDECGGNSPTIIYRAMLTSAPQPPAQPAQSQCGHCGRQVIGDAWQIKPPDQPELPINCGSGHCSCIECVVAQETCKWTVDEDGMWESSCGSAWEFNWGGPVENGVKFCQNCGKTVEIEVAK